MNPAAHESIRSFLEGERLVLLAGSQALVSPVLQMIAAELRCEGRIVAGFDGPASDGAVVIGHASDDALAAAAVAAHIRGHLVIAATPALDAIGAMQTLVDAGTDPSIVIGLDPVVIAIHAVRRLCVSCAEPIGRMTPAEERLAALFEMTPLFRAAGCAGCRDSGFAGSIPYAQVFIGSDPLPIDDHAWAAELVATGRTTIEEVARLQLTRSTAVPTNAPARSAFNASFACSNA